MERKLGSRIDYNNAAHGTSALRKGIGGASQVHPTERNTRKLASLPK